MNLASSFGLSTKPNLAYFHFLFKRYSESKNPRRVLLFFRELLVYNEKPDETTFALLVKSCSSCSSSSGLNLLEADQIQTHLIKSGPDQFTHLSTALLDFYAKLGYLSTAQRLFGMRERDVVSWNALICGFWGNGYHFDALYLFVKMLRVGFSPSPTTLVGLVPSCARHELIFRGWTIHGFGIKAGLDLNSCVKNAFTSMHAKCADLGAAERLFQEMVDKSVVSWNTMIGAYGQNGFSDEAMLVFKQTREESVEANPVTMACLLSANANPDSTHSYAIETGLSNELSVITSLVCEYARRGNSKSAEYLYMSFPHKNLVALTAIIQSHV